MKSKDRVKTSSVSSTKPGRTVFKKIDDEHRKKEEEEHTQQVFEEFVATFEGNSKTRTWVKGGVVKTGSEGTAVEAPAGGRLYKPVSKYEEKQAEEESSKVEAKKNLPEKPPALGKKKQEQKKSKLEQFKEELKLIQQQREQRHAMRQGKNVPSPPITHSELDLSDVGRNRDYRSNNIGLAQHNTPGTGLLGAATNNAGFYSRRGARDRRDDYPYDFDGDQTTTNLFLGNLNPKMTEQQLCEVFGRYGPLASVKIMWPRTEEDRSRGRNCGFVAFMNRKDGERALENIRGKEILGFEMKLGWGKSVPIPLYPVYIPPALLELVKPPPPSGLPFNAQPREWLKSVRQVIKERTKLITDGTDPDATVPPGPDRKPFDINKMAPDEIQEVLKEAVVKVVTPGDRSILALIHRLIEFVVLEGPQFEAAIMHREQNNPQYRFLFDYQSSEHTYYRWKLWSILHGESVNKWRTEEFRMFEGGPLWRPPPMNLFSGGMPEDLVEEDDYPYAPGYVPPPQARRRDADGTHDDAYSEAMAASRRCGLTEAQRGRFTQMLLDLEPCRTNVGDVMVWCMEHADSASDITDCILESLSPEAPVTQPSDKLDTDTESAKSESAANTEVDNNTKAPSLSIVKALSRLFLISDILYNSSAKVPNASYFRKCFENRLPEAFKNLHLHYKNAEGKLKAEQLKQKVMMCFRAWEDWAVYPNEFLIKLQNIFLGLVTETDDEADLAGVPLAPDDSIPDILGNKLTAVDHDVEILDGQPLVQYDGDPLDVDGSPLVDDAEVDDLPITTRTQTISGKDSKKVINSSETNRLFVPSKWETVDPDVVESEAVTTTSRWELLVDSSSQPANDANQSSHPNERSNRTVSDVSRWTGTETGADDDDDLDGQPLTGLTGLVAYDDEDAASSVSSDLDNPPPPKVTPVPPTPATIPSTSPSSVREASAGALSNPLSEERRTQLREIELKVLRYQDELEASRKSDSSITEEAINKQIQRYRERMLERLNEEEQEVPISRHSSKPTKLKAAKVISELPHTNTSVIITSSKRRHEHSQDRSLSPMVPRDHRDRSPPRSFRDRDRVHRRPISPNSPVDIGAYDSPSKFTRLDDPDETISYSDTSRHQRTNTWELESSQLENRSHSKPAIDELEEGEASDEDDANSIYAYNQRTPSKRKPYDLEADRASNSPKVHRKRHRSRSKNPSSLRHSRRSGTPSPGRKRKHHSKSSRHKHR